MPSWLTDLIPVAPWLVACGVLIWVAIKIFPYVRKIMHFIDDVAGEPARPGVPARPGLMERVTGIETRQQEHAEAQREQGRELAVVRHEVTTNHGSSLKDSVKRLEARVDKIERPVVELHDKYVKE